MSVTTTSLRQGKFETRFWHKIFEEEVGRVKGHFGPINTCVICFYIFASVLIQSSMHHDDLFVAADFVTLELLFTHPAKLTHREEKTVSFAYITSTRVTSRHGLTGTWSRKTRGVTTGLVDVTAAVSVQCTFFVFVQLLLSITLSYREN
jgi:hypothetical protein